MNNMKMFAGKTTITIPTLKEAPGIGPTIGEKRRELGEFEDYIVSDAWSSDKTPQIAQSLGAEVFYLQRTWKG